MTITPRVRVDQQWVETLAMYGQARNEALSSSYLGNPGTEAEARAWRPDWDIGTPVPLSPSVTTEILVGKTMSDVVDSEYLDKLKRGELLPMNPMLAEVSTTAGCAHFTTVDRRIYSTSGRWRAHWVKRTVYYRPQPVLMGEGSIPWSTMETSARARLARGYMDLLTSVSEVHKTVAMIIGFKKNVKERLISLLNAFALRSRRKKFRTFSDVMNALSSFWLEARYGWRILFFEYNSIVDTVNAIQDKKIRRSFNEKYVHSNTVSSTANSDAATIKIDVVQELEAKVTTVGVVDFRGPVQMDPLTTAWELLPLSLVIDMFWNVGDVLAAWSPVSRVKEEALCRVVMRRAIAYVSFEQKPPDPFYERITSHEGSIGDSPVNFREVKQRVPVNPSFSIDVNINLSMLKALDLGSIAWLLRNALLRIFRPTSK